MGQPGELIYLERLVPTADDHDVLVLGHDCESCWRKLLYTPAQIVDGWKEE